MKDTQFVETDHCQLCQLSAFRALPYSVRGFEMRFLRSIVDPADPLEPEFGSRLLSALSRRFRSFHSRESTLRM